MSGATARSRMMKRIRRTAWFTARATALAILSPLLEKNVVKTLAVRAPLVLSMGRVIVLLFAIGMLRQMWHAGIAGWPDAMLAVAIVLALPVLAALERVNPNDVVEIAKALIDRVGVGSVRSMTSVYAGEPSKYDDHRDDSRQ